MGLGLVIVPERTPADAPRLGRCLPKRRVRRHGHAKVPKPLGINTTLFISHLRIVKFPGNYRNISPTCETDGRALRG